MVDENVIIAKTVWESNCHIPFQRERQFYIVDLLKRASPKNSIIDRIGKEIKMNLLAKIAKMIEFYYGEL